MNSESDGMERIYKHNDALEAELQARIKAMYQEALDNAVKRMKDFLRKKRQVDNGTIKPPAYYDTPEKVARWKEGFERELLRQYRVEEIIMDEICRAGKKATDGIRDTMGDIYADTMDYTQTRIAKLAHDAGINVTFAQPDKREILAIINRNETAFTKLAYRNLGQNVEIRHKLQNALALSSTLGEGRDKLIKRISDITGQSAWQAKRVAQTERTRSQSQASYQASQEASNAGITIYNRWHCRFRNSRDAHMRRHGQYAKQGECFPDSVMRYPGDPNGPAEEVINCYCALIPKVLLSNEYMTADGKIKKRATDGQID